MAIKVLDKQKMADNIDSIMEEVHVLNMLDHPNIVNHMETYDDTNLVYIGKLKRATLPSLSQTKL